MDHIDLNSRLNEKKEEILSSWFDLIIGTYPAETARFLRNQKDRFANPVGQAIHEGIEGIFGELINGEGIEKVSCFLDAIIRVRATQDFTASQSVAFLFFLKSVIREKIADIPFSSEVSEELAAIESRIDSLALLAFDIFMQCREKLYDIKANEMRNMTYRLLKQANLVTEMEDTENRTNFIAIQKKEVEI